MSSWTGKPSTARTITEGGCGCPISAEVFATVSSTALRILSTSSWSPARMIGLPVRDEVADAVVNAIQKCANIGNIGGGKIWVSPVEHMVRARTGERDGAAV